MNCKVILYVFLGVKIMKKYQTPNMEMDVIMIEDSILTSSTINVDDGAHNLGATTIFDDDF